MKSVHGKSHQKKLSELAERIKNARIAARLSQAALAKGIGVSDKSISSYEQGRSVPPFEKLKKIAVTTNHPFAYFTEEHKDEAALQQKFHSIEQELAEIKKLLKKNR